MSTYPQGVYLQADPGFSQEQLRQFLALDRIGLAQPVPVPGWPAGMVLLTRQANGNAVDFGFVQRLTEFNAIYHLQIESDGAEHRLILSE